MQVKVLQSGEAAEVGDTAVCQTFAPSQVEVLQSGEAAQVGDATVCRTYAPSEDKAL
jgi:hypothetical protein